MSKRLLLQILGILAVIALIVVSLAPVIYHFAPPVPVVQDIPPLEEIYPDPAASLPSSANANLSISVGEEDAADAPSRHVDTELVE
ncbi:MAG: hypothetical protein Q8O95_04095 [bacterium]|nr:hypothetical protein [bacterium]